ncbi:hypothetical protein [Sphingopyxis sp. 22461]|uniref:hypothetical protein n=1 Tax=Sphingopyxis sp. 22461 TaxID=3453923 RepID=UPI003F82657F
MEMIMSRSRIAGAYPHYSYRVLVPAEAVTAERRRLSGTIAGPDCGSGSLRPYCAAAGADHYYAMQHAERSTLAPRIGRAARRIEALIMRTILPEIAADSAPVVFGLDCEPGDACALIDIDNLNASFDRIEPKADILTAFDLELRPSDCRRDS